MVGVVRWLLHGSALAVMLVGATSTGIGRAAAGNLAGAPPSDASPDLTAPDADAGAVLARALPERVLDRVRRRPTAYVEAAAELILSFGGGRSTGIGMAAGIDAEGVGRSILAERARLRAREVERLLRADLDNDGAMTADEVAGLIGRTHEGGRGRLKIAQEVADSDGDGTISAAELSRHAAAVALATLDEEDAAERLSLMAFDRDRDGSVTLNEVLAGVAALVALDLAVARKEI